MGLFKRLTKSKNPDSKKFKREMAYAVCGQHIKYVTEKRDGVDEVIGRNGGLNIRNDEFIVSADNHVVFRCNVKDMQASELLSKEGAIITAPDLEKGGEMRTIIVYYVYFR